LVDVVVGSPAGRALDRPIRSPLALARRVAGFNVVELVIVLVVLGIAAAVGAPLTVQLVARSKLQGASQEVAAHLLMARMEAMTMGRTAVVVPDYAAKRLFCFLDENENLRFDGDVDRQVFNLPVPAETGSTGVYFMGPDGVAGTAQAPAQSVEGLTSTGQANLRAAVFQRDGSIRSPGAFRLGDGKQPQPNVIEVRVAPQSTARVEVRKFVAGEGFRSYGSGLWEWY
jgi:Tfp pilus assembly protein FimT